MVTTYRRNPTVEAAPLQDETILFDPEAKQFCVLNGTAGILWDCLAEPATIEDLCRALTERCEGVEEVAVMEDVRSAIARMFEYQLVSTES